MTIESRLAEALRNCSDHCTNAQLVGEAESALACHEGRHDWLFTDKRKDKVCLRCGTWEYATYESEVGK